MTKTQELPSLGVDAPINLDRLIETRLLVSANSGAGKSWALRRLLEQTYGSCQHLVIDPDGEFHTLREGYDYVLVGKNGECAANLKSAALLATRLLELNTSAILDISELSIHDRQLFVQRFLESLMAAPRELWHPVIVVIDEAHSYAPQDGHAESSAAVIDLMARGRKRGFCGLLATQRISKLHKDAAAEANNRLIGRSALDIDMKRAAAELGFTTREEILSLRKLEDGHFYAFGPALSPIVKEIHIGPVKTTHLKAGQRSALPTPPRDRVKKVLAQLADLPAEAEEEARSVAEWRAKLKQAEAENLRLQREAVVQIVEKPVITDDQLQALAALYNKGIDFLKQLGDVSVEAAKGWQTLNTDLAALTTKHHNAAKFVEFATSVGPMPTSLLAGSRESAQALHRQSGKVTVRAGNHEVREPARPPARTTPSGEAGGLTKSELRILEACAWVEVTGLTEFHVRTIAFLAGFKLGGHFVNLRGRLSTANYINYGDHSMSLTEKGRAAAPVTLPSTLHAFHDGILSKLDASTRRLLRVLIDCYPTWLTNEEFADRADFMVGGHFVNMRGRLSGMQLITYHEGKACAANLLFPEGLS